MQIEAQNLFNSIKDGQLSLKVQGNSMAPFLRDGRDVVTFDKPDNLKIGDIVVFKRADFYIMHRIIEIDGGCISTLGDNLSVPETDIPIENVCGKAVSVVRKGKTLTPSSPEWLFYSRLYIRQPVRKIIRKLWR